jgi:membrane-associated protein
LHWLIDFFLHLDKHLSSFVSTYHMWTYVILFVIIFCETGLVITPFLPGDSLIFAAAALAALPNHPLNVWVLWAVLCAAAIIGDSVNYFIGNKLGHRFFRKEDARVLKRKYLDDTHDFYARHGVTTIVLARFVPIVRTIAPFVAGMGDMSYPTFFLYNVIGGVAWVTLFTVTGYFFGTVPFIKRNFSLVIIAVVLISIIPLVWKGLSERSKRKKELAGVEQAAVQDTGVPEE